MKKIGSEGWNCSAIGDICLIKGKINKWKIQYKAGLPNIMKGIVTSNIDLNKNSNYIYGYVTNLNNFDKYNLGQYSRYLNYKSNINDIVEIIVDLNKGELSFSINGKEPDIFCDKMI